MTKQAK